MTYDVVIVGGGPGGSTTASLLKKYKPELKVLIVEREQFPREHIGESQLPVIGSVLQEMGVWDKVEAANFIIKFGASYTWGNTREPWIFGFIPDEEVKEEPRPQPYGGWRAKVALQVDRAIYDKILLDHAQSLGCEVLQGTSVSRVLSEGDRVLGLELSNGATVKGRYYVDASGNAAVLRRALNVKVDAPTLLQNVALWDYFEKPGMNKPILERGSIRIRIRSVPFGWVWYIALSDDRTSVGLVCPATYLKSCGKTPEALFDEALAQPADLQPLLQGAGRTHEVRRTNDWSYVAERACGENWFLCGESLGFADPILSAGLTLTHTCGRHLAYTLLELDRGEHDRQWLLNEYNEVQRRRVIQHMKFAEYWYTGNGFFSAIQDNCKAIADSAGLELTPSEAFRWLSNGGIDDDIGQVSIGGLSLAGIKGVQQRLSHKSGQAVTYHIDGKNIFKLKLEGAGEGYMAGLRDGRILRVKTWVRGHDKLPMAGAYGLVVEALQHSAKAADIFKHLQENAARVYGAAAVKHVFQEAMQCLEMMVARKWVAAHYRHGEPSISMKTPLEGEIIYSESEKKRRSDAAKSKSKARP